MASSQAIAEPSPGGGPPEPVASFRQVAPFHAHVSLAASPDASLPPKSKIAEV
jgi:hypothetical protein